MNHRRIQKSELNALREKRFRILSLVKDAPFSHNLIEKSIETLYR